MDLRARLIGPFATAEGDRDKPDVDVRALVHRLLLFDKYILESNRLTEFPHLVSVFGFDGTMALLKSADIQVHCDALTIGQVGQLSVLESRVKKGLLPLGSYAFSTIKIADRKQYIHLNMQHIERIDSLNSKQVRKLKHALSEKVLDPPADAGILTVSQLKQDLTQNSPVIAVSTAQALTKKLGRQVDPSDFSIKVHQIDESDFRVDSDLSLRFGLNEREAHDTIEAALLAVAGLNQRLEYMQTYQAVTGFREGELSVFENKLAFLGRQLAPEVQEERFKRVLTITGMPDAGEAPGEINMSQLLEIRQSDESRRFREWLRSTDQQSDEQIREQFHPVREKLKGFYRSGAGAGITSVLDTFVLERVIPQPGPTSFLSNLYPSIFKRQEADEDEGEHRFVER